MRIVIAYSLNNSKCYIQFVDGWIFSYGLHNANNHVICVPSFPPSTNIYYSMYGEMYGIISRWDIITNSLVVSRSNTSIH